MSVKLSLRVVALATACALGSTTPAFAQSSLSSNSVSSTSSLSSGSSGSSYLSSEGSSLSSGSSTGGSSNSLLNSLFEFFGLSSTNSSEPDDFAFRISSTSSEPGRVLKSEDVAPGMKRIWFSTHDQNGNAVPVSAMVLEPTDGTVEGTDDYREAPTVVLAPGTRGPADSCSTALGPKLVGQGNWALSSINVNYERPFYSQFTDRGQRLVITDYIGLGGPGTHTYVNRIEQGQTVLDAARAVRDLGMANWDTPVGLFGYSQGGGAVAAAAELHQEYAPELNLVATFAGAPPADLKAVLTGTSPKRIAPVMAFAINSFAARDEDFADAVDEHFNLLGKFWLWETSRSCLVDANLLWSWLDVNWLTKSGATIAELIETDSRFSTVLEANNLGQSVPFGAMLIASEEDDDLIPHDQVVALYEKYKDMGADVSFLTLYDGELDTTSTEDTSVDSDLVASSLDYVNSAAGVHAAGLLKQFGSALNWLSAELDEAEAE